MKKVYITSLHLQHGGVEMAISLLANALTKGEYNVEILCIYNLGEPKYDIDDRVKITYLTNVHPNKSEFKEAVKSRNIFSILKEGIYAVRVLHLKKKVMIQQFKQIEEGCIISTRNEHSVLLSKYGRNEVKKIAQLHHDHNFDKKMLGCFQNKFQNIDFFVLLTETLKEEISQVMTANTHTKCVVIPNFLPDETQTEVKLQRKNQVVTVGRLHEVKGMLRLLEIWKQSKCKEQYLLKIIGEGEERQNLEKYIKENALESCVQLTGAMEHGSVMREMASSKVYLMASLSEAFPFVLIEAMSNGLPIISFDVRVGPRAIIQDNKDGFLIPDGQNDNFVSKLDLLMENENLREKMSKNAVERSKRFLEKEVMKSWLEILEV